MASLLENARGWLESCGIAAGEERLEIPGSQPVSEVKTAIPIQ